MDKPVTRDEFKTQFGSDTMDELRHMARADLKIEIPFGIKKSELLDLMFDAYAKVGIKPAEQITPMITDAVNTPPTTPVITISCKAPKGIRRGDRFWPSGKQTFAENELSAELLSILASDRMFLIETTKVE